MNMCLFFMSKNDNPFTKRKSRKQIVIFFYVTQILKF